MQCLDLKTAPNGNLLFIREIADQGSVSQVYEINPENGEIIKTYPTGINSRYIYIVK